MLTSTPSPRLSSPRPARVGEVPSINTGNLALALALPVAGAVGGYYLGKYYQARGWNVPVLDSPPLMALTGVVAGGLTYHLVTRPAAPPTGTT